MGRIREPTPPKRKPEPKGPLKEPDGDCEGCHKYYNAYQKSQLVQLDLQKQLDSALAEI